MKRPTKRPTTKLPGVVKHCYCVKNCKKKIKSVRFTAPRFRAPDCDFMRSRCRNLAPWHPSGQCGRLRRMRRAQMMIMEINGKAVLDHHRPSPHLRTDATERRAEGPAKSGGRPLQSQCESRFVSLIGALQKSAEQQYQVRSRRGRSSIRPARPQSSSRVRCMSSVIVKSCMFSSIA